MDLQKIGTFMKDLRKEKGFTQEQLAESLNVSRRTVSRWETGMNMPDLDLLMELSDLYAVDLREMLNGERKSENKMTTEMQETELQVAEYSNTEKQRAAKVVRWFFILGIIALVVNIGMEFMDAADTFWAGFLKGGTIAIAVGAMILGLMYTTGALMKLQAFKMRMIGKEKAE